jgi:protein gp37
MGQPKYQTDGDPRTSGPRSGVAVHPEAVTDPLRWRKPRKVFVNSMADLSVGVVAASLTLAADHRHNIRSVQSATDVAHGSQRSASWDLAFDPAPHREHS